MSRTSTGARPRIVFTVDVECWGQSVLDRNLPIRAHAARNVRRLLRLLEDSGGGRGTFFVLGKFALRHPNVVEAIHAAGHEVGSHGHGHEEVYRLTPTKFRDDLRRAADAIAAVTGERPRAYRAPVFSIHRENLWALRVLAEEGYEVDSSVFPFDGPRYGIADWPRGPVRLAWPDGVSMVEYPLTVLEVGGRRWPVSGGGYARLMPRSVLWRCFARACREVGTPPVFYCHPYELDAGEITRHYPGVALKRRLHQGLGRGGFARKLQCLVERFELCALGDVLGEVSTTATVDGEIPDVDAWSGGLPTEFIRCFDRAARGAMET